MQAKSTYPLSLCFSSCFFGCYVFVFVLLSGGVCEVGCEESEDGMKEGSCRNLLQV